MTDTPATTATKAIIGALVRHGITTAGAMLVTHGWVDKDTADAAVPPLADYLVGAGLVAGSAAWAGIRARVMHSRWVQAWIAPARPLPPATPPTAS